MSVSSYLLMGFHHDPFGGGGASATEIWDYPIQGGYSALDVLRILAAVAAGKTTIDALGAGLADVTFRAIDDSQTVVAASMDDSERTEVDIDAMKTDIEALSKSVFDAVRGYVDRGVAKLIADARAALEERVAQIPAGKDGAPGRDGIDGKDGAPGDRGEKGDKGIRGEPGKDGKDGVDGRDGAPGERGEKGDAGERGERGIDGAPGRDGKDGAPGAAGERGEQGAKGDPGERGADGAHGRDGIDGKDGAAGLRGEKGDAGTDGRDGRDGKSGEPGRDAWQIDVLTAIEGERSYGRGTVAQWNGGLIRAVRTTDPLKGGQALDAAGWVTLIKTLCDVSEQRIDERTIEVVYRYSDGSEQRFLRRSAEMIYRGLWAESKGYDPGDCVTWGGSMWIKEQAGAGKPGDGGEDGWRLVVKKGSPGKDGTAGKDGLRGPQGERGAPEMRY